MIGFGRRRTRLHTSALFLVVSLTFISPAAGAAETKVKIVAAEISTATSQIRSAGIGSR